MNNDNNMKECKWQSARYGIDIIVCASFLQRVDKVQLSYRNCQLCLTHQQIAIHRGTLLIIRATTNQGN